jgi:hypothetical protein
MKYLVVMETHCEAIEKVVVILLFFHNQFSIAIFCVISKGLKQRACVYPTTEDMCHLVVAALEFGTTTSGYAFSWQCNFERDKLKIFFNNWFNGTYLSAKTLIVFLLTDMFH